MTYLLSLLVSFASVTSASIGLDEHVGARVPADAAFTDPAGHRVALGDLLGGRPVVLVLAYARCTSLCSVVLHGLTEELRDHPDAIERDFVPVVITLDPRETAAESAARQAALAAAAGRVDLGAIRYLRGDRAAVDRVAGALGFRYAWDPSTRQYAHPAVVFVLTPDGRIAEYLRGVTFDDLPAAVARAGRGVLTPSISHDLLACFHFDPALRRYGREVRFLFGAGAAVVLASLVGLMVWLCALDRRRRLA